MNDIVTREDLLKALRLEGCACNFDTEFERIADALFNRFAIRKGDRLYRFVEIEFYHNLTDPAPIDSITYPRTSAAGQFFFHQSGVDLTFLSHRSGSEPRFGGILIRSIRHDDRFILGPYKVMDELFDSFDAFGRVSGFPEIVEHVRGDRVKPYKTTRWNIKPKEKAFRFTLPYDIWKDKDHKGYAAFPWYYDGSPKK